MAATLPLIAHAQKPAQFGELLDKYSERDGYTVVHITKAMLDLIGIGKGKGNFHIGEMMGAINGVKQITIISANDSHDEFTADMKKVVGQRSGLKLLTSITENGQNILFHYKEIPGSGNNPDNPTVSELIMVMYGPKDNLIIRIQGNFSIKQISSVVGAPTDR